MAPGMWSSAYSDGVRASMIASNSLKFMWQFYAAPGVRLLPGRTAMDRRSFLKTSSAAAVSQALPVSFAAASTGWRTYETVTRVELLWPKGVSRAWVPLPLIQDNDWHKTIGSSWSGNAARAEVAGDGKYGVTMLHAEWRDSAATPVVEVTSRFMTRDRAVD